MPAARTRRAKCARRPAAPGLLSISSAPPASAQLGLDSLRRGETLVLVGLFGGSLNLALPLVPMRARRIIGSFVGTLEETREMLALVRDGRITPPPIETRPLDQASRALEDLRDGNVIGRIVLRN